jgi:hypothetical protein
LSTNTQVKDKNISLKEGELKKQIQTQVFFDRQDATQSNFKSRLQSKEKFNEIVEAAKQEWLQIEANLKKQTYRRRADAVFTAICKMHEEKDNWFKRWFGE